MTFYIPPINTATDSFGQWIYKSNQAFGALSNNAITTDSGRATPSNTAIGNAAISGVFSSAGLIASANVKVGAGTSNVYMEGQTILVKGNLTTNNSINSNGMILDGTTLYYREIMTISNTVIRGANVTSNSGFFENLRIGNTTSQFVRLSQGGLEAAQVNTNILYVTGPNAFASIGTNQANVFITDDGLEVYANPTGSAVVNSKMTATDLWISTIHANTMDMTYAFFSYIGVGGGSPFLTFTGNTVFDTNVTFRSANTSFVNGFTSNGWVGIGKAFGGPETWLHVKPSTAVGAQAINSKTTVLLESSDDNLIEFRSSADTGKVSGLIFADNNQGGYIAYTSGGAYPYADVLRLGAWGQINFQIGTAGGTTGIGAKPDIMFLSSSALSLNAIPLKIKGSASGEVTLQANSAAGNPTFTLPASVGTAGHLLYSDGAGKLGWKPEFQIQASDYIRIAGLGVGVAYNPPTAGFGEIRAGGNITAYYSDERLKENIEPISDSIQKVTSLRGVTFNSNHIAKENGYLDNERQVGVLAQDVQKVLPEAVKLAPFDVEFVDGKEVSKSGENYLTVQYEKIVPLLIEAIKELKKEIDELKASR